MTPVRRLMSWGQARPTFLLFLFAFTLYALSMGPARNGSGYSADGTFAFEMAKSVMIDRGHAYLRDQNRNFARWGVGLPTAFMPIVAFAEPLANKAPQRDRVPLDEYDVLLVNQPALGGLQVRMFGARLTSRSNPASTTGFCSCPIAVSAPGSSRGLKSRGCGSPTPRVIPPSIRFGWALRRLSGPTTVAMCAP